jgi:hypothetical protein
MLFRKDCRRGELAFSRGDFTPWWMYWKRIGNVDATENSDLVVLVDKIRALANPEVKELVEKILQKETPTLGRENLRFSGFSWDA